MIRVIFDQMTPSHDTETSPSSTGTQKAQALKRRNRNRERVRVTRACDRCKRRKIKCNGKQPCEFCIRAKEKCTFAASYCRGRLPSISAASGQNAAPSGASTADDSGAISNSTGSNHRHHVLLPREDALRVTFSNSQSHDSPLARDQSIRQSPELPEAEMHGQYIGPASGVSFLLRVQKRLRQAISVSGASSIFTFGDAPLKIPESDPSFCMMLPRADSQRLVDRYFDFAMPTYRFLHKPTLQSIFDEFYDTLGIMNDTQNASAKVALLFMVFAQALVYMPDNDRPGPLDLSTRYFQAAEHHLSKEKGSIRLASVQARLTQCYYLLTQSRINHCWSLFGTVSHLALAIGLNRNRPADPANGLCLIESECRRRTFWCAYTLDAYLSAALGRPRTFHDDDIDSELPACIEDDDLAKSDAEVAPLPSRAPSTMLAAIAHMKIAQIISNILTSLYSVKPVSAEDRAKAVEGISQDLHKWRSELSRFLDVDIYSTCFLISIFQRQRNVLNLTYWHAIILTHRPFVLSNLAQLSQTDRDGSAQDDSRTETNLKECLDAAMQTVNTINDITESRQLFRAFWITAYFAFNATIMLYIYVIQQCASPPEVYSKYFLAAARCQSHIAAIAEKGSLSERYCLVLEELRVEALRHTKHAGLSEVAAGNGMYYERLDNLPQSHHGFEQSPSTLDLTGFDQDLAMDLDGNLTGVTFPNYSAWEQFTSLLSSGLGNMDGFMNYDSSKTWP